jgi:zinc protease
MVRSATAVVLAALLLPIAFASAQQVDYEKYELDNGLTVILHEDHTLPVATVNLWYRVGGKDESPGRSGFAHLFEHLMFMGTERVPGAEFDQIMEAGGGWNNASTGFDRTNYYSFGPAELLPTLLWLDADRMEDLGRMMDEEKLEKQRSVVLSERREGIDNAPYGRAEFEIGRFLFPPDHPYHYDIIGTAEDIEAATVEDVKDFFARFYVPNNASLVVAGDFDGEEIRAVIARTFGTLSPAPDPKHAVKTPVTMNGTKRAVFTDKVQYARLYMGYHSPACYEPGDAEMDLAAQILSDGKSSRLYKRLVYDEKLATHVSAYQMSLELGSVFLVVVTARQDVSLDEVEEVVDEVLDRFVREGPDEEELERCKASWERRMLTELQSIVRKADRLNKYEYYYGEPNSFERDLDRFRKAETKGVREWAARVLQPGARLVMRVLPEEEGDSLPGLDIRPEASAPRHFEPTLPEVFTLSNGVEVQHWERRDLPLVNVAILLRAGSAHIDDAGAGCAALVADMLDEGAGERGALAFSDELDLLGATFSATAETEQTALQLSALQRNFAPSLDLLADALLRPRFEEKEWDRVKSLHLDDLRQAEDRPGSVAYRVGRRVFYGDGHPYGRPVMGTTESVERIGLRDAKSAYDRFFLPGNASIFIAGDLSKEEAREALERVLGEWRNSEGFVPAPRLGEAKGETETLRVILVQREDAPQTVVRFFMPGPRGDDPDRVRYELLNTIMGGTFACRLNTNLREEHGYTYGAGSGYTMTRSTGYVYAYADVQTEVTGAALEEFLGEFRRISGGDVTPKEAQKARETNRMEYMERFQGLRGLIRTAIDLEEKGLPFSVIGEDLSAIARTDAKDLNDLAPKAFPFDRGVIILVGDRRAIEQQLEGLGLPEVEEYSVSGEPM